MDMDCKVLKSVLSACVCLFSFLTPSLALDLACDAGRMESQIHQGEAELAAGLLGVARATLEAAVEGGESCESSSPEMLMVGLGGLAVIERIAGNPKRGLKWADQAIAVAEQPFPSHELFQAEALENRAQLLSDLGRYYDAEPVLRKAIAIWERQPAPSHIQLASCYNTLSVLHLRLEDPEGARRQLAHAMDHAIQTGDDAPKAAVYHNLATAAWLEGDLTEGLEHIERALGFAEHALGPEHPYLAEILKVKAKLLSELHRKAEARRVEARLKAVTAKLAK